MNSWCNCPFSKIKLQCTVPFTNVALNEIQFLLPFACGNKLSSGIFCTTTNSSSILPIIAIPYHIAVGVALHLQFIMGPTRLNTSLSKVLGSDRGPGLDARTETAVLGSLKTVVLGKHLDKL